MALVARKAEPSLDASSAVQVPPISGNLYAGEDLDAASAVRIDPDGTVYMSNGAAADANARVHGFINRAARSGEPVTIYPPGTRFGYSDGNLTPGQPLYLAGTAGRLDDTATTGDPDGVAHAVNDSDIVFASRKL